MLGFMLIQLASLKVGSMRINRVGIVYQDGEHRGATLMQPFPGCGLSRGVTQGSSRTRNPGLSDGIPLGFAVSRYVEARRQFASGGIGDAQPAVGDLAPGAFQHEPRASSRRLDLCAAHSQPY